jgi:3-phenylpropionate/trans-cinnamate dioxygenase ferredoxin component
MPFEKVATIDDLDVGSAIAVEVGGIPIALVRVASEVVKAIHNICSHQYYELAPEGCVEDSSIECALHGSVFDLDTGDPRTLPAIDPLPVYACEISDRDILVDVDRQRNTAQPPRH